MLTHKLPQPQPPARLVVLGGGGFVGGAVVKAAKADSIDVLALGSRDVDLTAEGAAAKLEKLLKPHDSVVFAAAIDNGNASGSEALLKNIFMAQQVAQALRNLSPMHLIYIGSDAVYAPDASLINEKTAAAPATLYGVMHRARELLLETETRTPLAILRLTAIYGAGDTHNAYGPNRFVREAGEKKTVTLFGGGEERRDHLHAEDAARLILAAACRRSTGILNVASGQAVSFHALAAMIAAQTGARIKTVPRRMAVTHRQHDATDRLAAFPSFLPMPIESGIRATIKAMER